MKKRILSLSIALCLTLSLMPATFAKAANLPAGWVDVGPADAYYTMTDESAKVRVYPAKAEDGKSGYVDEQHRWVIPPVYKHTSEFLDSGYAWVTAQDDKRYIINTEGELFACIGDCELVDVQGGNAIIGNSDGSQGIISLTGKVIAPARPYAGCTFELGGKYVTQSYIIDINADRQQPQMWIFDATGKDLFPNLICSNVNVLSDDRMAVSTGQMTAYGYGKTRIMDFNGKDYPLPEYYRVRSLTVRDFVGGLAQVDYHAMKGANGLARFSFFINKQGKLVTPDMRADLTSDIQPDGCFYATTDMGKWRKYSAKGKDLGAAPGEMSRNFANFTVVSGHWREKGPFNTLFNLKGKQIPTPPDFGQAMNMPWGDDSGNIYYEATERSKNGLMDPTGKVIIPAREGYITRVGNYYRQDDKYGTGLVWLYDLRGNLLYEGRHEGKVLGVYGGRTVYIPPDQIPKDVMAPISKVTTVTAVPSQTKLMVNGKAAAINAYLIKQNNYMKLRDLAALLSGTQKQFEVTYDTAKGAINILTGNTYTPAGGELTPGSGGAKSATTGTSPLYIDGKPVRLKAYNIGGNNFYKLRDVMQTLDVNVGWNGATSSASLDTALGYTTDGPTPGVYRIHSALEPVKYVDISEGSQKDGAHVITWDKGDNANQKFSLEKVGGKYRIIAFHSGKAISIDGIPNSQLIQKSVSNDPNQFFTLIRQPSGGYNIVAATGQYLGVAAGSTNNGTAIIVWDKTGSKGQEFFFE